MKLEHPVSAWARKARGGKGHHEFLRDLTIRAAENQPDFEKALAWCRQAADHFTRRPRQTNELRNLLTGAYELIDRPTPSEPKPAANLALRNAHRGREGDLDALRITSDLTVRTAGQALLRLFDPSDWICVMRQVERPEFDFAGNWAEKPDLGDYQFVAPNAFHQNTLSRGRQGVLKRLLIVHEGDDKGFDHEAQIGPVSKLTEIFPLLMVVWSGGKSLHAWYQINNPSNLDDFTRLSALLGGDTHCHKPNHPVRLPLGLRPGRGRQEIIYARKENP